VAAACHQIEDIALSSFAVYRGDGLCALMVMPALLLDVHIVEHLRRHLAIGQAPSAGSADPRAWTAGSDVGDDREIANGRKVGHVGCHVWRGARCDSIGFPKCQSDAETYPPSPQRSWGPDQGSNPAALTVQLPDPLGPAISQARHASQA